MGDHRSRRVTARLESGVNVRPARFGDVPVLDVSAVHESAEPRGERVPTVTPAASAKPLRDCFRCGALVFERAGVYICSSCAAVYPASYGSTSPSNL